MITRSSVHPRAGRHPAGQSTAGQKNVLPANRDFLQEMLALRKFGKTCADV
jgi:hypothetical protein